MSENKEYCLEIKFKDVGFDSFYSGKELCPESFHGHLILTESEIELQIFYPSSTYFGRKFSSWAQKIRWDEFGQFISTKLLTKHERLKKFDLSNAAILGIQTGSQIHKELGSWITLKIDYCKSYWNPVKDNVGTAEFYLNESGFQLVSDFYGVMWPQEDGGFSIGRMNDAKDWYKLDDIDFSPQYNFAHRDSHSTKEAVITKEPKFQFQFKFEPTLSENRLYKSVKIFTSISSFYYRNSIDFVFARIHRKQHTILIKRVLTNRINSSFKGSNSIILNKANLNTLFEGLSQFQMKDCNVQRLGLNVEKFWQSGYVDLRSSLLLKFAILEISKGGNVDSEEKYKLKKNEKRKGLKIAKEAILEIIEDV
ncbi:MAG: hypothetical protein QNK23_07925 [Crocinitomicaceae bacterium]|nr:hypothetical protein [Crocinitomicaceae bacterium]